MLRAAVDSVFGAITDTLRSGSEVRDWRGSGHSSVVHRKATNGRNPRTGEAISIPASKQPKFKAGKTLKGLGQLLTAVRPARVGG